MKPLYVILMIAALLLGYFSGFAGYPWTKWVLMPITMVMTGAIVRFFWGY